MTEFGTAIILPGTDKEELALINELIELSAFERVDSNKIRPTDKFKRMYNEVGPTRYSEIESPTRNDEVMVLIERVKIVIPKLVAEYDKVIDDRRISELIRSTCHWLSVMQEFDAYRRMGLM